MIDLHKAAQQALEALEWHYRQGHSNTIGGLRLKIDEKALRNLKAALAQQDERDWSLLEATQESLREHMAEIHRLRAALAQQAEPVQEPGLSRCPQCNGPADNGHDRSIPPNPYLCTKCMAEPVHKCPNCASLEAQNTELDRNLAEVERAHGIGEQP